jgi:hypothetical protein
LQVFANLHKLFFLPSSITVITRESDAGTNIPVNSNKTHQN